MEHLLITCRAIVEPAWEPPVDYLEISCYNAFMSTVYRVAASHLTREGRWCVMGTYEILSLLFLGGSFLIVLLTYIDRHNKK